MEWILWGLIALVVSAYLIGKRDGVRTANRSAVRTGAWVRFVKSAKATGLNGEMVVKTGTEGIVSCVDKWGTFSVWFADPLGDVMYGGCHEAFGISDLTAVRTVPLLQVSDERLTPTLQAWTKHNEKMQEMFARVFPPGFLEFQRFINSSSRD